MVMLDSSYFSSIYNPLIHEPLEVTTLVINNLDIRQETDEHIASFFQQYAAVKTLYLNSFFKERHILAIPQTLRDLTSLDLSNCAYFDKNLLSAIAKALGSFSTLKSLSLRDSSIGDAGIQELCSFGVFESNPALSSLDLFNCKMTYKGLSVLEPHLLSSTSLTSLSLGLTAIGGAPSAHGRLTLRLLFHLSPLSLFWICRVVDCQIKKS